MGAAIMIGVRNLTGLSLNHPILPAENTFVTEVPPENWTPTIAQPNGPAQTLGNAAKRFAQTPAAFTETLKPARSALTKKHGDVIRFRLQGFTFEQIAGLLGINSSAARQRFVRAKEYLHEKTLARIELANKRKRNSYERETERFFIELNKNPIPGGALTRTAIAFGLPITTLRRGLVAAGVNVRGEFQRKELEFALKVAATMDEPIKVVQEKLGGVIERTIYYYRKRVREKKHLQGALELVENPEAQQWWEIKMPLVLEENGVGTTSINLTVRNETVQKDLALFDATIQEAKAEMIRWHPDREQNWDNPNAAVSFRKANERYKKLKRAKKEYMENERKFREKYVLPLHELIKVAA